METDPMTTEEMIIEIFYRVDDKMRSVVKHSQAKLFPSEVVTLAILFAIKGVGNRAYYRWLKRDWIQLFPHLPERTRLFRLFKTHHDWANFLLAEPTILGVIDSYGIELIHPIREGRTKNQIGKKGKSNHRWIIGGKLCLLLNKWGLIVGWECDTANEHDSVFHSLIEKVKDQMIVLGDNGFHSINGDPINLKICPRGKWNNRMFVETIFSMLTQISHFKKFFHRVWDYFEMHLSFAAAAFNLLVLWNGIKLDNNNFFPISIAEFNL